MYKGFFERLVRKWWLMLIIGIVIGLAAGLPIGGKVMPEELAGATIDNTTSVAVLVGDEFTVSSRGYPLIAVAPHYDFIGKDGNIYRFRAKEPTGEKGVGLIFGNDNYILIYTIIITTRA